MSYYELLQQDPMWFIIVLFISAILTLVMYGAFPLIFAATRKSPITKKKYKRRCYWINAAVMLLFMIINGSVSNGGPYLLWTWAFSSWGMKILNTKGVLTDESSATNTSVWRCSCGKVNSAIEKQYACGKTQFGEFGISKPKSTSQENPTNNRILFCRKCGTRLIENGRFCCRCGTKIAEQ